MASSLKGLLSENEIEIPDYRNDSGILMVACPHRLPTRQVVLVPFEKDAIRWAENCERVWKGLKGPALRLFMPQGLDEDSILGLWKEQSITDQLTYILGDLPLEA